jgi:hypothetical protein
MRCEFVEGLTLARRCGGALASTEALRRGPLPEVRGECGRATVWGVWENVGVHAAGNVRALPG